MVDNDLGTPVVDDPQQIEIALEPKPAEGEQLTEEQKQVAGMSEADIANQTFSDVGHEEPEKKEDDPKPAAEKTGEDDPSKILVPKEPDAQAAKDDEKKPEPRKGSAEWYEKRLAAKQAHIDNIESDNYNYRQQRREARLDQSRQQHQAKVDQLQDFDVLSAEEETELIQNNPEDYKTYVNQLAEYKRLQGLVGKENGHFTPEEHVDFQLEEYDDFLKQAFQFDYAAEAKKDRVAADKRYEELNATPEVIEMAEALKGYQPGKSGLYTAKQMHLLYQGVTKDHAVTTATINARKNLTNEINTTQERVTFDGLPKAEAEAVPKDVESLTTTEIGNMGPAELKIANDAIQAAIKKEAAGGKTKKR